MLSGAGRRELRLVDENLHMAPDGHPVYDANPRRPEVRVMMVPRAGHETYAPGVEPVIPTTIFADTVKLGGQFGDLRLDVALATSEPARSPPVPCRARACSRCSACSC